MKSREGSQLPTGSGEKILEERRKETLPAVEVKNIVSWVNPAFKETAPLSLQEGEPTNLAVFFAQPGFLRRQVHKVFGGSMRRLTVMPEFVSTRSGLFGSVLFKDSEGNLYRDLDIKGVGFAKKLSRSQRPYMIKNVEPKGAEAYGLVNRGHAIRDRDYSERFIKAGIRTHRVVGIIQLEEIAAPNGKKIPVSEAKSKDMIPKEMQPVAVIRAFGTKERIDYLGGGVEKSRREAALQDAILLVAQELSVEPKDFSLAEYLKWFAENLGIQIAKIRKLRLHHHYLSEHNITLDCRVVDLDSVVPIEEAMQLRSQLGQNEDDFYKDDLSSASNSLWLLHFNIESILRDTKSLVPSYSFIKDIFEKAYQKELNR